jgi:cell wall-associated NlpC family hydrolase
LLGPNPSADLVGVEAVWSSVVPNDRNHRLVARGSLAACALVAGGLVVLPAPSSAAPDPRIPQVQERVGRLYHQAEVAAERWNTGREELVDARAGLRTLRTDLAAQERRVTRLRDQVGAMVALQVQSSPMSTTSQLLTADDPDSFLAGLAAVQSYSDQQAVLVGSLHQEEERLVFQQEQMSAKVAAIADDVAALHQAKAEVDAKAAEAKALLGRLEAERRQRVQARIAAAEAAESAAAAQDQAAATTVAPTRSSSAPQPPTSTQASGSAQAAVNYALAQVGEAYVYGSAGPSSWDCSGLTMMAWGAGGVSLPHSSTMQSGMGTSVSMSSLQPGDLVFYYSPISHVGMYIGNGQLVHAPNPSSSVEVVPVDSMPIAAIRHFG